MFHNPEPKKQTIVVCIHFLNEIQGVPKSFSFYESLTMIYFYFGTPCSIKLDPLKIFKVWFQQGLLDTSLPSHKPLPEYKTAVAKKPKFVFSHYGYLKCLWDVIIIIATIYVAIIVPYNAAFFGAKNDETENTEELFYCAGGNCIKIFVINWIKIFVIFILFLVTRGSCN